jgi:molybdopterin converting factor small subunit
MVWIRFYGVIRGVVGTRDFKFDFKGSMGELLETLCELYPMLGDQLGMSVVLLNNMTYTDEDPVGDEDEIIIMPALGGG